MSLHISLCTLTEEIKKIKLEVEKFHQPTLSTQVDDVCEWNVTRSKFDETVTSAE